MRVDLGRCGGTLAVTCLCACLGPLVPVVEVDQQAAESLRREIKIVDSHSDSVQEYDRIGPISALSCKNKLWSAAATEENAIDQLLFRARMAGASAVTNLRCKRDDNTSLETNCWSSVTCSAEALRATVGASSP